MPKPYKKITAWLIPPFFLAVIILFFSGCLPRSLAFIERPFSSVGAWVTDVWTKQFPSASSTTYCAASDSELLVALAVDQAEFDSLKIENQNLREQLSFFERESFQHITASIISRSVSPIDSVFIIDRGSDDGVKEGAAVIVSEGHLIGKVIKVSSKTSTVQSILGRGAKSAISLLNSSRTLGISEGSGSALLTLRFVPQNETVAINDLVVTSGLEAMIPPGLIVGVVTSVERDPAAPFQEATVEPLIDPRRYNSVSVINIETGL
ncbi:MAG: rod shape-determining protein MreC [Candidatus Uhrbacteria bacterium]